MGWTRSLMTAGAAVPGVLGLAATFVPDVLLRALGAPPSPALMLGVQVTGALYVGFAALNWMARDNLIGGIYSRPVAIGNLMHFLVAGLAMLKLAPGASGMPWLWPLTLVYAAFAAAFGWLLFRHPIPARAG